MLCHTAGWSSSGGGAGGVWTCGRRIVCVLVCPTSVRPCAKGLGPVQTNVTRSNAYASSLHRISN